jgi:hypothetical protein
LDSSCASLIHYSFSNARFPVSSPALAPTCKGASVSIIP